MSFESIVTLIIIGINIVATIGVYVYQAKRYSSLDKSLRALNEMLDSIDKYKNLFKPDDIIDRLSLKHQLERENLQESYKRQTEKALNEQKIGLSSEIAPKVSIEFIKMHKELIDQLRELATPVIRLIVTHPSYKANKTERDLYIKENFPKNHNYLVEACDTLIDHLDNKKD